MKRILLLLLILTSLAGQSQVYNNEWIDYSRPYYKFKIGVTGLYRINQPVLANAGLSAAPAEYFQLWRNGEQVPIYTSVQTGTMGAADYIEFWAEINDGKPDAVLYRFPDYQMNNKWSLQTDTVAFFLTVNPAVANNLRLVPTPNNLAGNTLAPEPFFIHTTGTYFRQKVNSGRAELVGDSYTYSSSYDYGEGLTTSDIAENSSVSTVLTGLFPYTGAGAPTPILRVNAAGNAVHPRYFKAKINGDSILGKTINYYDYAKESAPFNLSLISGGTANIEVVNMGTDASDRMVVAMVEIQYPRLFNFGFSSGFTFSLPASVVGNYLEITNFAPNGAPPVLYDLTNGKRYLSDLSNPVMYKFALEPSATERNLVMVSESPANYKTVTSLQTRNFVDLSSPANQGNFLIITHPSLTQGPNGTNPIADYKAYRSSPAGGSYQVGVYMIDELVDQFGLGIKKHPLSIRNFLRWARVNFSTPLKDVLLIGKGVNYPQYRVSEDNPDIEKLDLIPSFGYPPSDNMLSAEPGSSVPLTPIGRISAIDGAEVAVYLTKVKEYEQLYGLNSGVVADKAWMKNVIHVTGASDANTSDILETALRGQGTIIADTLFGGHVNQFAKSSADAVQLANSVRLANLINNGSGILTYFGHSSASTLEFNLDNPLSYTNQGKYPVFIVMGCNAGNFFNFNTARFASKETLSERYVLAPERGSIAFLASTHLGIVHYLDIYNTRMYTAMSRTKYGATLGEQMDEAIREVFSITSENDFYARFQCEQFTLHGDPALKIYAAPKPDYVIEAPMVSVSPSFVSLADASFKVNATAMNIGKAPADTITIEVKRKYPNGVVEVIRRDRVKGIQFIDSLFYTIPIVASRDNGLNEITITLDADNEVDESFENNNSITKQVYIFEDEARPIYPYNYSIVSDQNVKLFASSANAFAVSRDYKMELDTTELFNSPFKVTRTVTSSGGVFEFTPGVSFTDSTVYYWRVSPSAPAGTEIWSKASFIYIPNSQPGFNQSHLYQHFKSDYVRLRLDSTSRLFSFGDRNRNIFIRSGVFPTAFTQAAGFSVVIDEDDRIRSVCGISNIVVNVLDPVSLQPW